jgi:hypothetical protein
LACSRSAKNLQLQRIIYLGVQAPGGKQCSDTHGCQSWGVCAIAQAANVLHDAFDEPGRVLWRKVHSMPMLILAVEPVLMLPVEPGIAAIQKLALNIQAACMLPRSPSGSCEASCQH